MRHAVLGGNLGGATSALLALDGGDAARRLRADALFPIAGFRRCLDRQAGYGMTPRSVYCGIVGHWRGKLNRKSKNIMGLLVCCRAHVPPCAKVLQRR